MQSCDIFCLPSLVEGRALVMQEAMSQGLPIIITPNTGGEDLIISGCTGFLVPIRNPEAIAQKINWFIDNKCRIAKMSKKAKNHALKYSWENYAETICKSLVGNSKR
jgi:glycosyltransferase involved in cell wall biosynthesis